MEFEIGREYEVVKKGSSISWVEIDSCCEFKTVTKDLEIGDIVKYLGKIDFPGCDVSYDVFEIGHKEGIFWPNQFGSANKDYFKKF
ncbi:MAG: hypothetical protein AMQ74_00792 [Candidatus Methanofastidiosum methylothiophilum]|uniref:Uncharacterized protein n=1 Tax=Candidatus Methanofastidiosum methylothiophilum TaxID=1705564 RepID=A0A150J589_9EURY|nr:MAG: hypothetical protein AMQ74_00792 [Candidatus Methanofastidiosum methylthiophilus]